jgi:hypothetical protein
MVEDMQPEIGLPISGGVFKNFLGCPEKMSDEPLILLSIVFG